MVREGATSRETYSAEGNAMVAWKVERRLPEKELNELMGKYHPLEWRTKDADMVRQERAAGKTDRHETYSLLLLRLQQSNITQNPLIFAPLTFAKQCLLFDQKTHFPKGGTPHGNLGCIQRAGQSEKGNR